MAESFFSPCSYFTKLKDSCREPSKHHITPSLTQLTRKLSCSVSLFQNKIFPNGLYLYFVFSFQLHWNLHVNYQPICPICPDDGHEQEEVDDPLTSQFLFFNFFLKIKFVRAEVCIWLKIINSFHIFGLINWSKTV